MAQIQRVREAEIQNGNLIDADDIGAELDSLVSESNAQDSRLTTLESSTITTQKTFEAGLKTDTISEATTDTGVTIDGVLLKNGMVGVTGTPTVNAQIGYDSNQFKGFRNGVLRTFLMDGDFASLPKGHVSGPAPRYNNAASIILPTGLKARNSTNVIDIELDSNVTLSLATSGESGLDTGSEASNTWYYVYLIKKTDGTTSAVFSTVNEANTGSITLPSGYAYKRQLPLAVRNDGSSNIIPFYIADWGNYPLILYLDSINVVSGGTSASYSTQSAAAAIPPISRMGEFRMYFQHNSASSSGATDTASIIPTGSGGVNGMLQAFLRASSGGEFNGAGAQGPCATNSSQQFDYKRSNSGGGSPNVTIDVVGYYVTEAV